MKKITLLLLALVGIFGMSQIVFADSSILSISPTSQNSTIGTSLNVSVKLDPVGNKICVVKGTLSFNKLSCKSISVASGLMAQTTPTCTDPSFVVGIPKCSSAVQNILSVSMKGTESGQANLSLTGVNIIGAGVAVPFTTQNGAYTIAAALIPTTEPILNPISAPVVPKITQPIQQQPIKQILPTNEPIAPVNDLLASTGATKNDFGWAYAFWALLALVVIYALAHAIYYVKKKSKQNK